MSRSRRRGWLAGVVLAVSAIGAFEVATRADDPPGAYSGPKASKLAEGSGSEKAAESTLKADAGDDALAIAGKMVTLNGVRSTPRGKVGYRWIQLNGPTVALKLETGSMLAFVPPSSGIYRFALVVADGSTISEPAVVTVCAVASDDQLSALFQKAPKAAEAPLSVEDQTKNLLRTIPSGPTFAPKLAEAFEEVAKRVDLYATFADAFSEVSRRLDAIIPVEDGARNVWVERLFNPLSGRLAEIMLTEGIDLRVEAGQTAALSPAQKIRLAASYRAVARGFRAAASNH